MQAGRCGKGRGSCHGLPSESEMNGVAIASKEEACECRRSRAATMVNKKEKRARKACKATEDELLSL